jgi:hypothetical protein
VLDGKSIGLTSAMSAYLSVMWFSKMVAGWHKLNLSLFSSHAKKMSNSFPIDLKKAADRLWILVGSFCCTDDHAKLRSGSVK